MPEYLSKEEIRQWRSSLERITLEEYAARLGKLIEGTKQTNDISDKVMSEAPSFSSSDYTIRSEKIQTIALKSFEKEKELTAKKPAVKKVSEAKKKVAAPKKVAKDVAPILEVADSIAEDINLSFKKALTAREQLIFDHFLSNKNSIVYAKDLARILELPRDYVYKYIKNLRSKLNDDVLYNADNGGYVLKV